MTPKSERLAESLAWRKGHFDLFQGDKNRFLSIFKVVWELDGKSLSIFFSLNDHPPFLPPLPSFWLYFQLEGLIYRISKTLRSVCSL